MTLDTIKRDGFTVTFRIEPDSDGETPWDNCDGHGPVSDWRCSSASHGYPSKRPGELVLVTDHGSARFYDFAAACKLARADKWGVAPYSLTWEQGAPTHCLTRCTGIWFDTERNMQSHRSDWHDDINAAIAQVYATHRATMTAREYAALAARADYDRLRAFCDGQWDYIGIVATASRNGIDLGTASLWGIESDSDDSYFASVRDELANDAIDAARQCITAINSATE